MTSPSRHPFAFFNSHRAASSGPLTHENGMMTSSPRPSVEWDERERDGPSRRGSQSSASARHSPTSSRANGPSKLGLSLERNGWDDRDREYERDLPQITTSLDHGEDSRGPHSAPLSGALRPPSLAHGESSTGPMRSSSSPEPRLSHPRGSSPSHSPTEARFQGLGAALPPPVRRHSPSQLSRSGLPNPPIPPRRSSTQEDLLAKGATMSASPDTSYAPDGLLKFPTPNVKSASKRGEPTYCGQCGQVVHGQFVRAMQKVYHLNCFRCKVRGLMWSSEHC